MVDKGWIHHLRQPGTVITIISLEKSWLAVHKERFSMVIRMI
jgi:hypothetical protein